jgi:hypothetical protein
MQMKLVELAVVIPGRVGTGHPGRQVATVSERVPEDWSVPQTISHVRKEWGDDAEGVLFLKPESFQESVEEWLIKKAEKADATITSVAAE